MMRNMCPTLTLVTYKNDTPLDQYLDFIQLCAQSGITALQLREKNMSFDEQVSFANHLKTILTPLNIPLIVNDNVSLALEINADGVHLGQTDGCPLDARKRLGMGKIIGVSINSLKDLETSNQYPIDYVGVGAIFPTRSKSDVTTIWEIEGLKKIAAIAKHPIIAIGGIDEFNTADVIGAGAQGVAIIGAIHTSQYPAKTIEVINQAVNRRKK